jgi:hypothetical protein
VRGEEAGPVRPGAEADCSSLLLLRLLLGGAGAGVLRGELAAVGLAAGDPRVLHHLRQRPAAGRVLDEQP